MTDVTTRWVVLELSERSTGEDPEVIRRSIQQTIRDNKAEVFIPAAITQVGEDRVVQYLVEGYAFVRCTQPEPVYFRLEGSKYVQSILTTSADGRNRVRHISCVTDRDIAKMRCQVKVRSDQGIRVDDIVQVTSGPYRGIQGVVNTDLPEQDKVLVHIKLRSKEALVTLPRSFLQLVQRAADPVPDFMCRGQRLHAWVDKIRPVLAPSPSVQTLTDTHKTYQQLQSWSGGVSRLQGLKKAFSLHLPPFPPVEKQLEQLQLYSDWAHRLEHLYQGWRLTVLESDPAPVLAEYCTWQTYHGWVSRINQSYSALRLSVLGDPDKAKLESTYLEWLWLTDMWDRCCRLAESVEALGKRFKQRQGSKMIQNILVDGHNLAYRALKAAPRNKDGSLKQDLVDTKGRPTGMIYRFLQSLVSLRKKFEGATLIVCWDGSPQKRKDIFPAYKSNRPESVLETVTEGFSPMAFIRDLLPYLGVLQVYDAQEETDDMIASLVRGPLKGQRNVIVSTDRDFMQLVTRTDVLLTPKVGSGKETLYDVDTVEAEYGVTPDKIVHLRAMLGDTSDCLPGVPRVPAKVLTSLLRAHGSIDGIYGSNFAGLTKYQYETLRSAESQVRLNVQLMALNTSIPVMLPSPAPNWHEAEARLQDVDVKGQSVLEVLLGTPTGFVKEA